MKKYLSVLFFLLLGLSVSLYLRVRKLPIIQISDMKLISPAFGEGLSIPDKYTCKGANVNPPFAISDVPTSAKSLVLIFEDPDAPFQTWYHWLLWNISPDTIVLLENSVPKEATQGTNSFGNKNYGGPCPPTGSHKYIFRLYALDTTLTLPPEATAPELLSIMEGHVIGETKYAGIFP